MARLETSSPADYPTLAKLGEELALVQADVDTWEERWLELAEESHSG